MYEDVERELFPFMWRHAQEWVQRHFEPLLEGRLSLTHEPVLVDADLSPYHILFDRANRRINGIVDFGTAGIGDAACDFACLINNYGEGFLRRVAKYYPEIESAVHRARFWAGTLELQWALAGLRRKDPRWSLCHIGYARDVMPVESAWEET